MFMDYILSVIRKQKELMEILQRKLSSDSPPGLVRHHTSHHTLVMYAAGHTGGV